jgi:hypothetical protein
MAFAPALEGKPHPSPWRAAKGGFAYDITIELKVPNEQILAGLNAEEAMRWVMALLRLSYAPYLTAPVTIDMPFADAAHSKIEPTITPFEVEPRFFVKPEDSLSNRKIDQESWSSITWVG